MHNYYNYFYLDTLAAAKKAAEDSEYESTTEQALGRGLRSKRLTAVAAASLKSKNDAVFDSSDDDNDDRTNKSGKKKLYLVYLYLTKKLCNIASRSRFTAPQMPLMPVTAAIENQTKIPFVAKTLSSVHKMNDTNDDQSMQKHYEDKSRTTGFKNDKDSENNVPSDLEIEEDDDNRFNVVNGMIIFLKCFHLL